MGFIEWQLLVFVTIVIGWLINIKFGIGISIFWVLWTLGLSAIILDTRSLYGEVRNLQLVNIMISSLISYYLVSNLKSIGSTKSIITSNDKNKSSKNNTIISSTAEHRNYLIKTIKIAKEEIIISSGFISSFAVDGEFLILMKDAIDRGVNVYLLYGYSNSNSQIMNSKLQIEGAKNLQQLRDYSKTHSKRGSVAIGYFNNEDKYDNENGIHEKILIRDDKAMVIGSFNWLSNKEGKKSEVGNEISEKEIIDKQSKRLKNKIIKLSK